METEKGYRGAMNEIRDGVEHSKALKMKQTSMHTNHINPDICELTRTRLN